MLDRLTEALKKNLADVVEWVSAQDMGQLRNNLVLMEGKAHQAAYDSLRLCAAVRIFEETVREQGGGDLLDFLEEDEE